MLFLAAAAPVPNAGATVRISGDGPALERAVSEAPAGEVLEVAPGTYRVHLRIDKPLTLIGEPGAVLDGGGSGDVVRIRSGKVVVRGFTIRNSGADLTVMNAGVFIERHTSDVTIKDNNLEHVLFGIYLDGPKDVRVIGNRIRGMVSLRSPDRGDGIHLWNDTGVTIRGNEIWDARDGIYIYVSNGNRIIGNTIHDLRYGVHYMYSQRNEISGNRTYATRAGYALMESSHLEVKGNTSDGDRDYGILMNYITYSTIEENTIRHVHGETGEGGLLITGGEGKGLFVYNSEFNTFKANRIADCSIGIHVTAGSNHNLIFDNAFIHNRVQVKYVQNHVAEWSHDGRGNYWSDYLGWDLNGDGTGDKPYRPVGAVDVLLWKHPAARLLLNSPAVILLRYAQDQFPVLRPPSVQDSHPLMRPEVKAR